MQTLAEFNAERRERYSLDYAKPHPNGIECPKCNSELWDSAPLMILLSTPPQKDVHCPECGHRGYRVA